MKIRLVYLLIFLTSAASITAQEILNPPVKPNNAFIAGETLQFSILYGFIVGGNTTLTLKDATYNGAPVFYASAIGRTTGLADKIYSVRDIYESWFDKETNLPHKQVRNISEGRYRHYNEITYNRRNNTVNSKLSGEKKVPEKLLDLASAFYYLRRIDYKTIKENDVILLNIYFSDGIFPLRLRYKGKETIRTKFGKISCHKIHPIVEVGRMFKGKDDLTLWLTDDVNCIPVLVQMDIHVVGTVLLKLTSYKNLANPITFH